MIAAGLIGPVAPIALQAKEASMVASNMGSSAELPQKKDITGKDIAPDGGAHGPMPQQDTADCHGHEMHPQKLVQLVGCHDLNAGQHETAHRLH
jgi:hypothetical protein